MGALNMRQSETAKKEITEMENKMMKNIFKVTALACLMAAASNAVAGPSANVQVKGTVTQGACTPTLTNNGVYDVGNISVDQLKPAGQNMFEAPGKTNVFRIVCSSPTKIAFTITDNRSDSISNEVLESGNYPFALMGLGKTSSGKNIGNWYPRWDLDSLRASGPYDVLGSEDKSNWVHVAHPHAIMPAGIDGNRNYVTVSDVGSLSPKAISSLSMNIMTRVGLSSAASSITDVENIDGNATLSIDYL